MSYTYHIRHPISMPNHNLPESPQTSRRRVPHTKHMYRNLTVGMDDFWQCLQRKVDDMDGTKRTVLTDTSNKPTGRDANFLQVI